MKTNILKSIGAVFAGLLFIGVTHSAIDAILESAGILPKGNLYVSAPLILFVIFYRAVFSLIGCHLTAKLAPSNPVKHALILGGIGTVLSAVGAIVTADMNLGPAWYAWSLVGIALPVAWLGGKLYVRRNPALPVGSL
jgi:MFS-type transporter involved in bile tolerance (Atg22 family)